ncbi:MAG: DUF6677 family protein [Planctomycetota bacterium]
MSTPAQRSGQQQGQAASRVGQFLGWGTFFCGFVPGLLQYRAGDRARAAAAFLSCTVLYFVGWALVGDRLFHFALVSAEPGGAWVPARIGIPLTLPEFLNLPAHLIGSIAGFDSSYEGLRLWRLPRPLEDLGGFLTAASGMLAAFWAADGHWRLRWMRDAVDQQTEAPPVNPALAAGVSWLLPGLGHALAGQKQKGLLMGAAVAILCALGLWFSQGHAIDRAIASVWWIGESLFGGGALFAALVTAPIDMGPGFPANLELGTNLCTVAGLMNLVVMIDAYTVAERRSFPLPAAAAPKGAGQ